MGEMKKVRTDAGWLININDQTTPFKIKHVYLGNIKPNKNRGNHFHKKARERFICIKGKIVVDISGEKRNTLNVLYPCEYIDVFPKEIHKLSNPYLGEALFIGLVSETFDKKMKDCYPPEELE